MNPELQQDEQEVHGHYVEVTKESQRCSFLTILDDVKTATCVAYRLTY